MSIDLYLFCGSESVFVFSIGAMVKEIRLFKVGHRPTGKKNENFEKIDFFQKFVAK